MTNEDTDFDTWFGCLVVSVMDSSGITFRDEDSVKDDYESGRDALDVADEISLEYAE